MQPSILSKTKSAQNNYSRVESDLANAQFSIGTLESLIQDYSLSIDKHSTYQILWFKEGAADMSVEGKSTPLKQNAVYLIAPGKRCQFQLFEQPRGYQLSFGRDFLYLGSNETLVYAWLDMFHGDIDIPCVEPEEEMQKELEGIWLKMQREFANFYLLRSEILLGLLNILMIHFSRRLKMNEIDFVHSKDLELVRHFKTLLKKHFMTKKMVSDYASELCVTANYLNRTVKKLTGFTASHHIQQQIIREAKRRAVYSGGSMKEIAYFLGFDNLAHFSKFFKSNAGTNFTSFKKEAWCSM